MKKQNFLITSTLLLGFLVGLQGCGPEKSQLDLERETKSERISQKSRENSALVGEYEGQVSSGDVVLGQLRLTIYPLEVIGNPNDVDPTFIPTLRGELTGYIPFLETENGNKEAAPGNENQPPEDNIEVFMNRIAYDGVSKIILEGTLVGSKEQPSINGTFNGSDTISGRYYAARSLKIPGVGKISSANIILKKKL